jgi:tetratricopeptide (TPR) repeat protein
VNLYSDLQKYELALSDYNNAIDINPNDATAYLGRGVLYSDLRKYDLALSDFSKAIEINPNLAQAYLGRSILYAILGQPEKVKIDLQQAAILFRQQNNMAAYEQVMQILQQLGG